jgi:hypothetical protein
VRQVDFGGITWSELPFGRRWVCSLGQAEILIAEALNSVNIHVWGPPNTQYRHHVITREIFCLFFKMSGFLLTPGRLVCAMHEQVSRRTTNILVNAEQVGRW